MLFGDGCFILRNSLSCWKKGCRRRFPERLAMRILYDATFEPTTSCGCKQPKEIFLASIGPEVRSFYGEVRPVPAVYPSPEKDAVESGPSCSPVGRRGGRSGEAKACLGGWRTLRERTTGRQKVRRGLFRSFRSFPSERGEVAGLG